MGLIYKSYGDCTGNLMPQRSGAHQLSRAPPPGASSIERHMVGMAIRKAHAEWKGALRDGIGEVALGSGSYKGPFSFKSRFENGTGTNPEELIGAAHAGCFTMALSAMLTQAGHPPTLLSTDAAVHIDKVGDGFEITQIELTTQGQVPGIDAATFQKFAEDAKNGCPVSKALAGTKISLVAKFV